MHIETLESRIAPAVTSSFAAGLLTIAGDDGANAITIGETGAPGGYEVLGLDAGQTSVFSGVTAIVVKLLGGTDSLVFNGSSSDGSVLQKDLKISSTGALTATINAYANIGGTLALTHAGADTLNFTLTGEGITAGAMTIRDGAGSAQVNVEARTAIAKNFVFTDGPGTGTSFVTVGGHVGGSVSLLSTASGSNDYSVRAALVGGGVTVAMQGANSHFLLENGSLVNGSVKVLSAGTGFSFVTLEDSVRVSGSLLVTAGATEDTVSLGGTIAGSVKVKLGEGFNSVRFSSGANVGGNVSMTSGTNEADLNVDGTSIAGALTLLAKKAAFADVDITNSNLGRLSLATGSGLETVSLIAVTIFGSLTAHLGDGDNLAEFSEVKATAFAYSGGEGNDIWSFSNFTTPGTISFAAGDGNNSLGLSGGSAKGVKFTAGGGFDTAFLGFVSISGRTDIRVASGGSNVTMGDAIFTGAFSILGGEGTDALFVETASDNFRGTEFVGPVWFKGGGGDDTVTLGLDSSDFVSFAAAVIFDGGPGSNTAINNFSNYLFLPKFVNFLV